MKHITLLAGVALLLLSGVSHAANSKLMQQANRFFKPLPKVMQSEQNPITPAKVKLGKMLFYETRLSVDGTVSCEKCHMFSLYGTDGLQKSAAADCKVAPRNAPTVLNAADQISEHWIGNMKNVEEQASKAMSNMPNGNYTNVVAKLEVIKGYVKLFKDAFPQDKSPVSIKNIGLAIGAFERTLVTQSPFDAYLRGDGHALTLEQKEGLKTFIDTGCIHCHNGTYVGGGMYMKFGIFAPYWKYTKSKKIDKGRYELTKNKADLYVFKVPVLRNVAMTPPYFHDGSVNRLQDAVRIMAKIQLNKDLSNDDINKIVSFLGSLTGTMSKDTLTVPVLPPLE